MTKWVCTVCGYVYEGDAAPAECPVCHVGADKFKKVEGDLTLAAEHEYSVYAKTVKNNPEISDEDKKYIFTRGDVTDFLDEKCEEKPEPDGSNRYDIIILDPPTFSNSKNTRNTLDINRDWPLLVEKCIHLLNKNGVLYFSTNSKRLKFDENLIFSSKITKNDTSIEDITEESIPEDYKVSKSRRCWKISRTEN